jgi:hypothetical protein
MADEDRSKNCIKKCSQAAIALAPFGGIVKLCTAKVLRG